jgi:threonine dehydratase
MKISLERWENTKLNKVDVFVDGASVARIWDKTFEIAKKEKLEVITCPENRICSTILEYLREDWIVVEPAGALSTDALKDLKNIIKWKDVVLILSWWNFDFERLQEVKERSMKFEGLKKYFVISFPQRPWALKEFLNCLWPNDDIARFEYLKKSNKNQAPVFMWIETYDVKNWKSITKKMEEMWFRYKDVTNDELYFDLLV